MTTVSPGKNRFACRMASLARLRTSRLNCPTARCFAAPALRTPAGVCRWKNSSRTVTGTKATAQFSSRSSGHPADPAAISGRLHSGALPLQVRTPDRELEYQQRRQVDPHAPNVIAEPERRGGWHRVGRRPGTARLQPHAQRALPLNVSVSSNGKEWEARWCSRINRVSTPIPQSSRPATAMCTLPTRTIAPTSSMWS